MRSLVLTLPLLFLTGAASAESYQIVPEPVTEWKPVYGEVETRNQIPARARIAGTVAKLVVTEGDQVKAGQVLARIEDEKLDLQIAALDAELAALDAQLENAQGELTRGQALVKSGSVSSQRLESLQTAVEVLNGQISANDAQRRLVERQISEGDVLAPDTGIVLDVPLSEGSYVTQGETLAQIGSAGVFLRLSIPERFAGNLQEGDTIEITGTGSASKGTIAKLYPLVESGRLQADVDVKGLESRFIGLRLPVQLPVGEHEAILVPENALSHTGGLDFVLVQAADGPVERVVIPGREIKRADGPWREILSGLQSGEQVIISNE